MFLNTFNKTVPADQLVKSINPLWIKVHLSIAIACCVLNAWFQ